MMVSQYEHGPDFQTPNEALISELKDALSNLLQAAREYAETTPEERQTPSVWYPRVDRLRSAIAAAHQVQQKELNHDSNP